LRLTDEERFVHAECQIHGRGNVEQLSKDTRGKQHQHQSEPLHDDHLTLKSLASSPLHVEDVPEIFHRALKVRMGCIFDKVL